MTMMDVGRRPLNSPSPKIPTSLPSRGLSPDTARSRFRLLFFSSSSPSGSALPSSPPSAALLDPPPHAGRSCWVLALACAMDDGGDVRLARKKGKTKMAPSAAAREAEGGQDSSRGRGRDRFQSLWRDYHDLLQETEAKKKRLESMNQRNLGLLAQVKFLRKKYSSFVKDDPQQTHHRIKHKKARQIPSPLGSNSASVFAYPGETGEWPSTCKNTNLDLNQDSAMDDERADCQGCQHHSDVDELNQTGVNEDMMPTDVNLPVCRDTGNQPVMLRGQ